MQATAKEARRIHVAGVVQGVGFRPFVYRLAKTHGVTGWVLNGETGVEIHAEGSTSALDAFVRALVGEPPPAAQISDFETERTQLAHFGTFEIRRSEHRASPTVRVSPDLPVCEECLRELFDPADRRYRYPYINCTNCGPRYSIIRGLPYDRPETTMRDWTMCVTCRREYDDPLDRRFHAQPVACPQCGPAYVLELTGGKVRGDEAIVRAAALLREGAVVAVKGIGGYHLACDARNAASVQALRERKYRKERPFALMVRDVEGAMRLAAFGPEGQRALTSQARPIVLAKAREHLPGVAPESGDLGVMLAYTPLHHLLFASGAPDVLVMTSANRSSEPIAYRDDEARRSLGGIADALLAGEREIARRIDDSVVAPPVVIRHGRGCAPQAVALLPTRMPIIAVGADLKNAVALVIGGQAFVSQHIGDLEQYEAFQAFKETIADLGALYELPSSGVLVAHDAHPEYASSTYAQQLLGRKHAVQHHRAHIASVLAEREAFNTPVLGFAFDGTGYGEDGSIWGGEVFAGDLESGLTRVAHLRSALLPGGDAAARFPVQAAAGFLAGMDLPDLTAPPFAFPSRYSAARELIRANVRVFPTTSMGRLFDTVAALLGFTREITFEAQAAMWVEHLARQSAPVTPYTFEFANGELDYRPLLAQIVDDRLAGRDVREIARAFHEGVARGILAVCEAFEEERVVVSGGVFQNALLLQSLSTALGARLWANRAVPPNDGGIALGQAAITACSAAVLS
jgi:hydrogenase maturation protein HypF